jgi:hypothetical protein
MPHIEGGCLCGRVRFSADAEPAFVGVCHCKDCQKFTGTAYATVVGIPAATLKVTGTTKTFTKNGDSGKPVHRRFCPECGSGIMDEAEALPGMVLLNAGSLDDASWARPAMQIYCDSAQPWARLAEDTKSFPKMPG